MTAPRLYLGEVFHRRLRPVENSFRYPVFFIGLDAAKPSSLANRLLSVNRYNLFSFHESDYGRRDGSSPEAWARGILREEGIDSADGEIWLQTFPRVLGYVFNPVSFWFCRDRDGGLRALLCEVSNTFGERHCYLVAHPDQRPIRSGETLSARKAFHVSPFFPVKGDYRFRFHAERERTMVRIDYDDADGPVLETWVSGRAVPLTAGQLARAFVRYPWLTVGVVARIHLQALRLWIKGVPFFSKPPAPADEVSR